MIHLTNSLDEIPATEGFAFGCFFYGITAQSMRIDGILLGKAGREWISRLATVGGGANTRIRTLSLADGGLDSSPSAFFMRVYLENSLASQTFKLGLFDIRALILAFAPKTVYFFK